MKNLLSAAWKNSWRPNIGQFEYIEILRDTIKHIYQELNDSIFRESRDIIHAKDGVINRFRPLFSHNNLNNLTSDEYRSFLRFENNRHWTGLCRAGDRAANDMDLLIAKMKVLTNDELPIAKRYNSMREIDGVGKAIITAIMQIVFPDKYGVWNGRVENGMKACKIWPDFERRINEGERYEIINNILNDLANKLDIDLWTLDSLWWVIDTKGLTNGFSFEEPSEEEQEFPEGRAVFRTHIYYERNNTIVKQKKNDAKENGNLKCCICDFDFYTYYGNIGEGFIECHHTKPISEYDSKTKTKLEDLALVCSNCHQILHRKSTTLTIEQLREIVNQRKSF
jgi:hypothetical protein